MMNIVDYLVGNTDRHWGNWGVFVRNSNNKPVCLHPLMDFNQAFRAYNSLDGANCQTCFHKHLTQKAAALQAVKAVLPSAAVLSNVLPTAGIIKRCAKTDLDSIYFLGIILCLCCKHFCVYSIGYMDKLLVRTIFLNRCLCKHRNFITKFTA